MPRVTGLLLMVVVSSTTSLLGQQGAAPVLLEALLAAPSLAHGEPSISPCGSELAYAVIDNVRKPRVEEGTVFRTGVPWFALGSDIWIKSISGGPSKNLTAGGNNWAPSWSPDGRRLAFLSDRSGGAPVNPAHLWVWERTSGKLRQVTDLPVMDPWGKLGALEWLRDSRTVLVKTYPEGMSRSEYATLVEARTGEDRIGADTGVTVRVMRFDPGSDKAVPRTDPLNLDRLLGNLALVDVETGAVRRVSGKSRIASYALSPDGRKLAWTEVTRYEEPGSQHILANLVVRDIQAGKPRRVATNARLAYGFPVFPLFSWAPTSQAIAYRTDGLAMPDEVYVISLAGGPARRIARGPAHEAPLWDEPVHWAPDAAQLFWTRNGTLWRASPDGKAANRVGMATNKGLKLIPRRPGALWSPDGRNGMVFTKNTATKRVGLARVDLASGRLSQLYEEAKAYSYPSRSPIVMPGGRGVVYASEGPHVPPNLWLAEAEGQAPPRQVTSVADSLIQHGGERAKLLEWRSLDGDTLHGALVYPLRNPKGTRFPLIVKVYGGEDLSDQVNRFGFANSPVENLLVFTSRGYAVLLADSRAAIGTPMSDLLKSVVPGVDRAIDAGIADPARIGLIGHSYGGYSTLALIVQSRRFKAAVMRAGLGDLVSAYGHLGADGTNYLLSWAERGQGRMGGTPWEVRERYIENSPIYYLDRIKAPLLIIQGSEDVHPFLSDQVFTGLRRLGKRVEYARYIGEGHFESLWSRSNQLDYLARVVSWFDVYLKGESS